MKMRPAYRLRSACVPYNERTSRAYSHEILRALPFGCFPMPPTVQDSPGRLSSLLAVLVMHRLRSAVVVGRPSLHHQRCSSCPPAVLAPGYLRPIHCESRPSDFGARWTPPGTSTLGGLRLLLPGSSPARLWDVAPLRAAMTAQPRAIPTCLDRVYNVVPQAHTHGQSPDATSRPSSPFNREPQTAAGAFATHSPYSAAPSVATSFTCFRLLRLVIPPMYQSINPVKSGLCVPVERDLHKTFGALHCQCDSFLSQDRHGVTDEQVCVLLGDADVGLHAVVQLRTETERTDQRQTLHHRW